MFTRGNEWPTEGGHDEAYRVEEQQHDENDEISSMINLTVSTRAQQRRLVRVTPIISQGDTKLDSTQLEFKVGSKIIYE